MRATLIKLLPRMICRALDALAKISPEDPHVYAACQRYVNRFKGENNGDIHTDGELRFMRAQLTACRTVFYVSANVGDRAP